MKFKKKMTGRASWLVPAMHGPIQPPHPPRPVPRTLATPRHGAELTVYRLYRPQLCDTVRPAPAQRWADKQTSLCTGHKEVCLRHNAEQLHARDAGRLVGPCEVGSEHAETALNRVCSCVPPRPHCTARTHRLSGERAVRPPDRQCMREVQCSPSDQPSRVSDI